jgi:hypothetical protein
VTSVVVCGIAGQLPLAGVALHYLQYCLGLRDLGVDVFYLEDNEAWPYHPWDNEPDREAKYTVPWLTEMFEAFDLPWAYRDPLGAYHGSSAAEVHARCADAGLLLNVSGGHEPVDHHRAARVLAYVDTDPGFVQVNAARGDARTRAWLQAHDVRFTFAERIGEPGCRVPSAGLEWKPTRQPVHMPFWAEVSGDPGEPYTTVMNWRAYKSTEWQGEAWGQKDAEFPVVAGLPRSTGVEAELALGGDDAPREELAAAGWRLCDPRVPTRTIWTFRDYIGRSRGEITVAKQAYVRSAGGWFSERSANYLAAGRPVIAQDTGWAEVLSINGNAEGLLPFRTAEEAEAAVRTVEADPAAHGRAARALAERHFAAPRVLERLLSDAGVS